MPKSGRKGERKKVNQIASDVKLSDFADSTIAASRLRKSVANSLNKEIKTYVSEQLWDENEFDEFEFVDASTSAKIQKRKTRKSSGSEKGIGIRYPIDIWFLIGEYIKPEDVFNFTLVCKDSYFVSRTYTFWINMYKRYYNPKVHLPSRLQPDNIERPMYLKACVIRALYLMYSCFMNRLKTPCQNAVHNLTNLFCTSIWHVQKNGKWLFHFKFNTPSSCSVEKQISSKHNQINLMNDSFKICKSSENYVNDNPDEGAIVLRIITSSFVAVPHFIMGSRLTDVKINLAHDMQKQKIRLTFCFSTYKQFHKNVSGDKGFGGYGEIVEFNPVENITVLNWWHPQYPVRY